LRHGANAVTISNNLVFMDFDGGICIGSGDLETPVPCDNCVVTNNIAINNPNNYGIFEEGNTGPNNVYTDNNIYGNGYAGISLQTGHAPTGTVTSNAQFVDYKSDGAGDYQLASESPDIGTGTSLGAPETDYAGVARPQGAGVDIGPYQYTGPATTPLTVSSESRTSLPSLGDADFEAPSVGVGKYQAYQYAPAGTPWTYTGSAAGVAGNGSGFTAGNPDAPEGTQVGFLQGIGAFSQDVPGWAAGTYQISFDAAQRGNIQASHQDFQVLVDGNVVGTFTPAGTGYATYTTAAFSVAAGTHTIMFLGRDSAGGDNTAFIDKVQVAIA
jgi:hypothetical protein